MLLYPIFFVICFIASIIGAICGIGGGVIIKPLLDAFNILDVETISFLSGCTVLSMTTYSVIKSKRTGESNIDAKVGLPLAIGAAAGGLVGKLMFQWCLSHASDQDKIGAIQAICLILVTIGTLIYTFRKEKIKTHHVTNPVICVIIGFVLGILSSFLGIGGGPINLVMLFYFFSMDTKAAAENSLYIIFFSQLTSLMQAIFRKNIPEIEIILLVVMVVGGICGGMYGRKFNKRMEEELVNRLFIMLMCVMICINLYNIYVFL